MSPDKFSEKIYRICTWFALLVIAIPAGMLLALIGSQLLAILLKDHIPTFVIRIICPTFMLLVCLLFVFLGWRWLIRTDTGDAESPRTRPGSIFLWLVPGFVLSYLAVMLEWHCATGGLLWGIPAVLAAAVILGARFPFRRHRHTDTLGGCGTVVAFIFFAVAGCTAALDGLPVDYTGDRAEEIPHLAAWRRQLCFPAGASAIRVCGSTMAFEWECRVSEQDFLDYLKHSPFAFRKPDDATPYYEYNRRQRNHGGITLRYFPAERRFTGRYSHH